MTTIDDSEVVWCKGNHEILVLPLNSCETEQVTSLISVTREFPHV